MECKKFLHDPTDENTIQTAMMEACESGDVPRLQRLLQFCNVKEGDPPVETMFEISDGRVEEYRRVEKHCKM